MKGVQIFSHSVRQLTNNLSAAFRISGVLYLVQVVVAALFGRAMMSGGMGMGEMGGMGGGGGLGVLVVLVVALVTGVWIAVGWHRYVLLGESPASYIPPMMSDRMTAYFLRSLLIVLIVVVAGAVLGMVVGYLAMTVMMAGAPIIGFLIIAILVQLPLIFVGFRLATSLPGAALGTEQGFLAGWNATQADWQPILQLSLIMALALWVINLVGYYVFGGFGVGAQIWQIITGWPVMMVGLSVLTTLYGHYIENRPLV